MKEKVQEFLAHLEEKISNLKNDIEDKRCITAWGMHPHDLQIISDLNVQITELHYCANNLKRILEES